MNTLEYLLQMMVMMMMMGVDLSGRWGRLTFGTSPDVSHMKAIVAECTYLSSS